MATSLSRSPLCASVLRVAPTLCAWNGASYDNAYSFIHREREEESTVPSPASPAHPVPSKLGMLGSRQKSLQICASAVHLGSLTAPWQGCRTFASQAPEQQQQQQPPAQQAAPKQPPPQQQEGQQRPPNDVTYLGPLSSQHKLLKRISISNTLIALAAAPAIVSLADNISLVSRYGLAASLVFFGLVTTGALHWVAHPYVHEMRYSAATGQIDVRTTTLLGSSRWHSFNVDDVQPLPWNRPVATFTARGEFYYIDVFSFPDEQLLRRLTPDEADVPKGYKDKEDEDD